MISRKFQCSETERNRVFNLGQIGFLRGTVVSESYMPYERKSKVYELVIEFDCQQDSDKFSNIFGTNND